MLNTGYIQGYAGSIIYIINGILVPVLIAIAFIVFLWGVYNFFIYGASDPKKHEEGKWFVLYGVIGFVLVFSLWGIVNIFMGTLGLGAGTLAPAFPTIGPPGTGVQGGTSNPFGSAAPTVTFPGANCPATGAQDCPAGQTCQNFQCVSANSTVSGTPQGAGGSVCKTDSDCSGSLLCTNGFCAQGAGPAQSGVGGGEGEDCSSFACRPGLVCNGGTQTCIQPSSASEG